MRIDYYRGGKRCMWRTKKERGVYKRLIERNLPEFELLAYEGYKLHDDTAYDEHELCSQETLSSVITASSTVIFFEARWEARR